MLRQKGNQKMRLTTLIGYAIFIGLSASNANAWTPSCLPLEEDENAGNDPSLEQVIQDSEYIGLYKVEGVKLSDKKSGDGFSSKIYEANLSLSVGLTQKPPNQITIYSSSPAVAPPSEFYFMKDQHEEMVEKEKLLLGHGYGMLLSDGQCAYGTNFVVGYKYLVFGGSKSKAAIEPILSVQHDPFYVAVKEKVREVESRNRP